MRRKLILLLVIVAMLMIPLSSTHAQDANAPLYVRFCTGIREEVGDEIIRTGMDDADGIVTVVSDLLGTYDSGRMTIPEAITRAEEVTQLWNNVAKVDCLAPMNQDVFRMTSELLIAMLYGQVPDLVAQGRHRAVVDQMVTSIASQIDQARTYLDRPAPTATIPPSPTVAVEVTPEVPVESTPTLRSSEELSQLLTDYLTANNVTVLQQANVQVFPGDTLVVVQLDRFLGSDGSDFDYENTLFTFNAMAGFWAEQPEAAEISQIAIETYEGTNRTLLVTTTGDNYRARYLTNTLAQDAFEAALLVEPPLQ